MPYVPEERRRSVQRYGPSDAGELNYQITDACLEYIGDDERISYARLNEVIGVLECAKLELYRRIAATYEDKKIAENGDVYPNWMVTHV